MEIFKVSKTAVSLWIKNGKSKDRAIPKYKHALLNQEKTDVTNQLNQANQDKANMAQQINDLNSKLVAAQQKTDELSQAVTDAQQTKDLSDDAVNSTK
jgi:chromosome segregation ATPase